VSAGDAGLVAAGSATLGAVAGVMFAAGLAQIGSARAAVLAYAEPLVAVAVGALVWHEPLHPIAAVGGALVIAAGVHVARQS
jgi:drug/metabolite transporter (DMT)-like permease